MKVDSSFYTPKAKIKRMAQATIGLFMLCHPLSLGVDTFQKQSSKAFQDLPLVTQKITNGLKENVFSDTRGSKTFFYNDSCLQVLKERILKKQIRPSFSPPINPNFRPYIGDTGHFGSPRPFGRVHLGVDIYASLYGRKPKKPVPVQPVTDGIVVYVQKANPDDNLEPNHVKIMGYDGKIYGYNHLARAEDYNKFKPVTLPELGSEVSTKDTVGYVGATGETAVWHLHMSVCDLDVQKEQVKNPLWQKLHKKHRGYAKPLGQVDPLDSTKAGPVSSALRVYRIDKGPISPMAKQL